MLIFDEPLLSSQPPLSGHWPLPRCWPLNRIFTVFSRTWRMRDRDSPFTLPSRKEVTLDFQHYNASGEPKTIKVVKTFDLWCFSSPLCFGAFDRMPSLHFKLFSSNDAHALRTYPAPTDLTDKNRRFDDSALPAKARKHKKWYVYESKCWWKKKELG